MNKKKIFILLLISLIIFLSSLFLILYYNSKNTYTLTNIIYDYNSEDPIIYNIEDDKTKSLFKKKIEEIGDKITVKGNKMIFNGCLNMESDGEFWRIEEDPSYIAFKDGYLMAIYAGIRFFDNEINIYVRFYLEDGTRVFLNFIYKN